MLCPRALHQQIVYGHSCKDAFRNYNDKTLAYMFDAGKVGYTQVVKERKNVELPDHRLERWKPHTQLRLLEGFRNSS